MENILFDQGLTLTFFDKICMSYMDSIVHTESYGQDNIGADKEVNVDIPEMEETNDVNESETDNKEDHEANGNTCQHNKRHKKDTSKSKTNILPELMACDSLCFPCGVNVRKTESPGYSRKLNQLLNFNFCWNIVACSIEVLVIKFKF